MVSKHAFFSPSASATKAANTTSVVKALVDKQTEDRQVKTKRLRAARLEHEVLVSTAEAPKAKRKATTNKRAKV